MATGLQGAHVWVKLKPPQNITIYGDVQDVVPNSHLVLRNVTSPSSSRTLDHFDVPTSAIEDLAVVEKSQTPQHVVPPAIPTPPTFDGAGAPPHFSARHQTLATPTPQRHAAPAFVDPAILSYGSASPARSPSRPSQVETPIKAVFAKAAQNLPSPSSPFIADASKANIAQKLAAAKTALPQQPQQPLFAAAATADASQDVVHGQGEGEGSGKKKIRRGQKSKKQTPNSSDVFDPPAVMNAEVSRNGNDMNGSVKRGKGWRSTPLLQPSPQSASPSGMNTKKSRRKQKNMEEEEFGQGDTTDIPDADFDFEGELKKFDKTKVWDEIRQGDTTADEDRLVSHNRARPGTYGGKNLHPTEAVLSPKLGPAQLSNEIDSSSDADTELNVGNGRSSSRHSVSRAVVGKKQPSRSNSGQMEHKTHPLATSILLDRAANRSSSSLANKAKGPSSLKASSPRPDRAISPPAAHSTSKLVDMMQTASIATAHFVIEPHMSVCPVLLPKALENLEAHAVATFGLTHENFTETAAIRIAEAAVSLLDSHGGVRRPSRTNTGRGSVSSSQVLNASEEPPVVVILSGNHVLGARVLAAARHFVDAGKRVIIAEASCESTDVIDPHVKIHDSIVRKIAKTRPSLKCGHWKRALAHIKNLSGPPAVIIDAFLAGSTTYDALPSASLQQEAREVIDWANRSRAPVLSIGCPSGVSGIDGRATVVDGEPLAVRPDRVLALGAPMQGLLSAMKAGEKWEVELANIGINIALKSDEAVAFGEKWMVGLTFVEEHGDGE